MQLIDELVEIKREGIIVEPGHRSFDRVAVLNPGTFQDGNTVHMFYRAVKEGNMSSIGYVRLEGPLEVVERRLSSLISPSEAYDCHGVEDPRIVYFEGLYYLFYAAYDGKNARVAYAVSDNLKTWEKKGVISPQISYKDVEQYFQKADVKEAYYRFATYIRSRQGNGVKIWDKDAFIFPQRIKKKIALVHRILPDIQIAYADSFTDFKSRDYWTEYLSNMGKYILLENAYWFENRNIGGGCPPLQTKYGWLLIYHAVREQNKSKAYSAAVALLDLANPQKVIARAQVPLFEPKKRWELNGSVNNVIFPTGYSLFDDRLYIYYGAADSRIAAASLSLSRLLKVLIKR